MLKIFPLSDDILQLVPAADPSKKELFSPVQIRKLAERLMSTDSDYLDSVHTEWVEYQLEDSSTPTLTTNLAKYWHTAEINFPNLSRLMQTVLCIPHSNAQSERVFSMLKKVYTDQRSDLCKDSINSLLRIKMNSTTCCHQTELDSSLLKRLKKSAYSYNEQHKTSSSTSAEVMEVNDGTAE